ncbi:hypothetical protein GJAV_G00211180 [Gymnothorax javanicus]|nr:hypothetical protein GJAV_G00211180 [Gymnothorax javanicus]
MILPLYAKLAEMAPQCIISLLFIQLSIHLSHEFQVSQPKTQHVNPDGIVTIDCKINGAGPSWDVQFSLTWKHNNSSGACLALEHSNHRQSDTGQCLWRKRSFNHVQFAFFHPKPDDGTIYVCEVIKLAPPPVQPARGEGTNVSAPLPPPAVCSTTGPTKPEADPELLPLNWVLTGLACFLLICCLTITCAYVRLMVQHRKDMDTSMTYVPMQPPQSYPVNRQNGDPESNTTYEDMRKTQSQCKTSRRDMNYNSHQMAY